MRYFQKCGTLDIVTNLRKLRQRNKNMQDPQEIFNQLEEIKKQQKEIRKEYQDLLGHDGEYKKIKEEFDTVKQTKKTSEIEVQAQMGSSFEKLEELKTERAALEQMLSDIALTNMMKGEQIAITDAHHNEYEPTFAVKFKKIG